LQEYYLCIQTQRLGCDISFSEAGGVEIEANWDKVKKITIPTNKQPNADSLSPLLGGLPLELKDKMVNFIGGCFQAPPPPKSTHPYPHPCFNCSQYVDIKAPAFVCHHQWMPLGKALTFPLSLRLRSSHPHQSIQTPLCAGLAEGQGV